MRENFSFNSEGKMQLKKCYRCNQEKSKLEFNKKKNSNDGLQNECRSCTSLFFKQWYDKNKRVKYKQCSKCNKNVNTKNYYKHKEMADGLFGKCKDCCKKYRMDNASNERRRAKQWQKKNKDRYKEYQKKWQKDNRNYMTKKCNEYVKKRMSYDDEFKTRMNMRGKNRENLKRATRYYLEGRTNKIPEKSPSKQLMKLFLIQEDKCIYCEKCIKEDRHIEHIIPLSKNGSNHIHNLALSCPECNNKKSTKPIKEWLEENNKCYETFNLMIESRNEIYF